MPTSPANQMRIRIILVVVLPLLILAMFVHAKSGLRVAKVLRVGQNGRDVLYFTNSYDPESAFELFRDFDGKVEKGGFSLPPDKIHRQVFRNILIDANSTRIVAARDNHLFVIDAQNLKPVRHDVLDSNWQAIQLKFSANEAYFGLVRFDVNKGLMLGRVFDINTNQVVWESMLLSSHLFDFENGIPRNPDEPPTSYVLQSPDSKIDAEHTIDGKVKLISSDGELIRSVSHVPFVGYLRFSPDSQRLIIPNVKEAWVVDVATGQTDKTPFNIMRDVVSDDGRYLGRVVEGPFGNWLERLFRLDGGESPRIEVVDLATQKTIRTIRPREFSWMLFLLAVPGAIFWAAIWLWSGRRETDPTRIASDVLIVSLLGMANLYLCQVYGGSQLDTNRFTAIGSLWFLAGMTGSVAIWFAFSPRRLFFRAIASLGALILIWVGPLYLWFRYALAAQGMPIACFVTAFFVMLSSVWMRWRGWGIRSNESEVHSTRRDKFQVSLTDLFMLPVIVGVLISTIRWVPVPKGIPVSDLVFFLLLALSYSVVIMVGLWTGLSKRPAMIRWTIGVTAMLMISGLMRTIYWNSAFAPIAWHVALGTGIGIYVALSAAQFRRADLRFAPPQT